VKVEPAFLRFVGIVISNGIPNTSDGLPSLYYKGRRVGGKRKRKREKRKKEEGGGGKKKKKGKKKLVLLSIYL
jgi:hypothetical protein